MRALPSRGFWLGAAGLLAVLGTAVYLCWPTPPTPPTPPRSAALPELATSPFRNTRPGVAYVGDAGCTGCHRDEGRTYRHHPMGRSLFPAATAPAIERYDGPAKSTLQAGTFRFQALREGDRLIHREWCQNDQGAVVAEVKAAIAYSVGAGVQGRSYFLERDGFLFQSPLTWYSAAGRWDLSPGYASNPEHFTRAIDPRCVYCHAGDSRPVDGASTRYQQPPFGQLTIGCERCHGPGELHVAARAQAPKVEEVDDTIVNPRHLTPELREAVCEQCHLQGEAIIPRRGRLQTEYRPGLPLSDYVAIFVRPDHDASKIVGHAEQMRGSACYLKSDGVLSCVSCHDAHGEPAPAEKVAFYQARCRTCHDSPNRELPRRPGRTVTDCDAPAAARQAVGDNCLTCHMPREASSSGRHLAVTDHRVPRHKERPPRLVPDPALAHLPLVPYHRALLDAGNAEFPRDLGLALVPLVERARLGGPDGAQLLGETLNLLDRAAARAPDDIPALTGQGYALLAQGQAAAALAVLEDVLRVAPEREQALVWTIDAAAAVGRFERAELHARKLVELFPHHAIHRERLAVVLSKQDAWPQALVAATAAVQRDPFRPEARNLLLVALVRTGDRARAQAEFATLGVIAPEYVKRHEQRLRDLLR